MSNPFEMPWVKLIKPEVEHLGQGELILSQTPEDLHKNHNGDMHAAVVFSVLEMAGMGVMTMLLGDRIKDSFVVLKDLHVFYDARAQGKICFKAILTEAQQKALLAAAEAGEEIEEIVEVVAYDENDKQVAHASVNGVIKPKR